MIFQLESGTVAPKPKSLADIGNKYLQSNYRKDVLIKETLNPKGEVGFDFYDKAGRKIGNGMAMPQDSIKAHVDNLPKYIGEKIDAYAAFNPKLKSASLMKE